MFLHKCLREGVQLKRCVPAPDSTAVPFITGHLVLVICALSELPAAIYLVRHSASALFKQAGKMFSSGVLHTPSTPRPTIRKARRRCSTGRSQSEARRCLPVSIITLHPRRRGGTW